MADEKYTFGTARVRLEEIASEVRKKDTSLEKSLDLLEEGVRLANICTELVDHTDMSAPVVAEAVEADAPEAVVAPAVDVQPDDPETGADAQDGVDEAYDDEDEPSDAASAE
ncbi:MAG: exodeoxyribonuclease VII small subunit [Coriobacteriia bacterium]